MKTYQPYVSGNFIDADNFLSVVERYTQNTFATVGLCNKDMLEQAISGAVASEGKMSYLSSYEKYEILNFISQHLHYEKEHFAKIISSETGKPLKFARIEAERCSDVFLIAAEEAKRIQSEYIRLDWKPYGKNKEALIKMFPVGVVAGITPFNFPLLLVAHKVAPAIAAGCPIILKPATSTPVSALELARIIKDSHLPKEAFSVLPMYHNIAQNLIKDERIKKISFTGSADIGWKIKQECGKKRVTMELGGNSAVIVTPSSNLSEAVVKCVTGAFAYSGQICIHTQRIFVHKSVYNAFISDFVQKTKEWKKGDPLDESTDVSVMIDEGNAIRVEQWVNEAVQDGASIIVGGKRQDNYFEPTVLTNTKAFMKVRKEEIFGPVVCIEPYSDFQEAISNVNDSVYGLQCGVFTNQINEMNKAFNDIQTGGVLINESATFRIDLMPFGGIKYSGQGREGIKYAIIEMSEMKLLLKPC